MRLVHDRDTDKFKGYCYVEFDSKGDLMKVLEMDGILLLENQLIRIDVAEGKRNDRQGFDRMRNRDRGPSWCSLMIDWFRLVQNCNLFAFFRFRV